MWEVPEEEAEEGASSQQLRIEGLRDWSPLSEPGNTFVAKLEIIDHIVAFCALKP